MRRHSETLDRGFTLIETMVATALLSVVLGLATSAFIEFLKEGSATTSRIADVDQVRTAMDAMSRTIRTAVAPELLLTDCSDPDTTLPVGTCDSAFVSAAGTEIVFFANIGDEQVDASPEPTRVTYRIATIDGVASLQEVRQKITARSANGYTFDPCLDAAACTRTLVDGLRPDAAGAPVFGYFDLDNVTPLTVAGSVPTAGLTRIANVTVRLPVGSNDDTAASDVTSRILLPNSILGR